MYWLVLFGGIALLGVAGGVAVWSNNRQLKLPLGRLYLLDNPMPHVWREHVLDLETLCKRKHTEILSFGCGNNDHVQLPGPSIMPGHATLQAQGWGRANRRIMLNFPAQADIFVDGNPVYTGPIKLQDKMTIQIGDYLFEYEDTARYEQVEIALSQGMIARGTLRSWDIDEASFYVALHDKEVRSGNSAEVVVLWSEVDSVAVMRKSSKRRRSEQHMRGYPAQIVMQSGRKYEGLLRKDYSSDQKRFFFFPSTRPNVDYMVIQAGNVEKVRLRWKRGAGSHQGDDEADAT